jgi:transcriptional regulator with XRE-family HTH domain
LAGNWWLSFPAAFTITSKEVLTSAARRNGAADVGNGRETMTRNLDATRSPTAFFGAELRRARLAAALTQDQLGRELSFSGDLVGKVETAERGPTPDFAAGCDRVFPQLDGLFSRLVSLARRWDGPYPQWFHDWLEAEQEATSLRWWEPMLVPGLLQTPGYARALFQAWQSGSSDDELDELVSGRIERQNILDRQKPPELWAVIDEAVLHRLIGSPKITYDQLLHLADASCRPSITVQVVPAEVGAHAGLLGAFIIAGFDGSPSILYAETAVEAQTIERSALVSKASLAFDRLRSEALPRGASRDLIGKVAEERWTP